MDPSLVRRWQRDVAAARSPADVPVPADETRRRFDELAGRYGEPHRRYHTIEHVEAVLDTIEELVATEGIGAADTDVDLAAVRLAGWLHDVVYDPTRPDNEQRSAALSTAWLTELGVAPATVSETARLIELTAGHEVDPSDLPGRVLVDADLAVLGAAPGRYAVYAAGIRAEYAHLDDATFRSGRSRILESFAAQEHLFGTAAARRLFESAARTNLATEMDQLSRP